MYQCVIFSGLIFSILNTFIACLYTKNNFTLFICVLILCSLKSNKKINKMNLFTKETAKTMVVTLVTVMVALYVHQKFVAPKIVVKK